MAKRGVDQTNKESMCVNVKKSGLEVPFVGVKLKKKINKKWSKNIGYRDTGLSLGAFRNNVLTMCRDFQWRFQVWNRIYEIKKFHWSGQKQPVIIPQGVILEIWTKIRPRVELWIIICHKKIVSGYFKDNKKCSF